MGQEGLSNDDQEMEELGQVTLEEEGKKGFTFLALSVRWRAMKMRQVTARQQSTTMFSPNLLRLRMTTG